MRVLHVIGSAHFGGIERLVLTLAKQQIIAGNIEPSILFASMRGEFIGQYEETGIQLYTADCRSGYDVSLKKCSTVIKIFSKFDLIHFHLFNPMLAWCAVRSGIPIVYTEHGNFGFGRKTTITDRIKRVLLRYFLNRYVAYITFNSEFTREYAISRYSLTRGNFSTIYNGVNIDDISSETDSIDQETSALLGSKFVIGTCSRFAGFKRIDRLIKAFSIFQTGRNDVVLLLVGDGVQRPVIERLVDELGIGDKVVFTGFRNNVHAYQAAMDICVYPSENEPFGLVAVESLLLGKTVLAFRDGGGLKEIIGGYSESDLVIDVSELCTRMTHYYDNQDRLSGSTEERKRYALRFNSLAMESGFNDVYWKVSLCAE